MQFLTLFAVGVLIASAYADAECFERKSNECKARSLSEAAAEFELDFCDYHKKLFRCLADAAADCNMKFQKSAEKVAETVENLCTKGTPLAREFNQHKKCLVQAVSETKCFTPIVESLITEDKEESRRDACNQVETVAECVAKQVARSCSRLTETFFRYISRPLVDLHKGYCEEVVFENSKRSVQAAMPNFFELWSLTF
ncbi:uncharacterized protein LOC129961668 [Argiope bruennichi]|uniref:Uncharacterized protein n=1 Tax=Argiope bruennichi TaxID=94029 RepID=A0A8T0FR67_ARGBR|nr:uncharacterized protein LOC129961668 [Argiope bruennichi]KAF8793664.1 hypothetical protein HNY73_001714 [Argiope bruennichi]